MKTKTYEVFDPEDLQQAAASAVYGITCSEYSIKRLETPYELHSVFKVPKLKVKCGVSCQVPFVSCGHEKKVCMEGTATKLLLAKIKGMD